MESFMLVLTRKIEESVVVGDATGAEEMVKVTVLSITEGKVRLGFDVARQFPVHRSEVWKRLCGDRSAKTPVKEVETH
jgi:carbon storage regulator CsrA